ncbi:uncharacterized protein LOC144139655 [Haemaphysalis longicornis]
MLQSLEHGDQSNKNITSDYILAIMRKWFTRDAIAGVARRFAECSRDHMSFFKLLGQDEMVGIARDVMGNNSPWLSLLTEGYDLPDLRPLDQLNFEQEALKVVQAFKGKLGPVGDLLLKPDAILGLARAASEAEVSLENITSIKGNLHDVAARPVSEASAKINEAASLLDGISGDNIKAFVEAMAGVTGAAQALVLVSTVNEGGASKNIDEYVKEHVNNWGDLQTQLKDSVKEFSDKVADIKQAVMDDVNQYFRHAKTQIRDRIGDCHSLYLLYATSVNALCDGAVRPTGGFWFSVWFFFIIGIAGCIAAFALSMQYAISGTQGAVEPALPRETVEKPADVASEPTGPADNLTAAVDTKKEPADFAGQSTKTAALPTIAVDTEDSVHT